MLAYCYENQIDQIHIATPGPLGLAALAIARILNIPISGTYHTAIFPAPPTPSAMWCYRPRPSVCRWWLKCGGPAENMIPDRTGIVCRRDDAESLLAAIRTLIVDGDRRRSMGRAARAGMEKRSFENAFLGMWRMFQEEGPADGLMRAAG